MRLLFLPAALLATTNAFVPGWTSSASRRTTLAFSSVERPAAVESSTSLYAKKKGKANAKLAALDALEALEEQGDLAQPLSKKEQKELAKKQKQEQKAAAAAAAAAAAETANQPRKNDAKAAALKALEVLEGDDGLDIPLSKKEQKAMMKKEKKEAANAAKATADAQAEKPKMSKKEEMLMKALEMEELDMQRSQDAGESDQPKLSKKELKALKKKEEKMAAKAAAKAAKKAERAAQMEASEVGIAEGGANRVNGDAAVSEGDTPDIGNPAKVPKEEKKKLTLEDKIRKERPPPRIRVMESSQPGFVSLRLENIGITFRNQEVLKDVTWGIQSGQRIGLVGKNGAGKTTQLRIMAGELEPTTGDVVKSSTDLRTAMLRQEFVDELVKERTLKEEFMSVFEEETQILQDLKEAENALENMSGDDSDKMQEILDRMQDLQQKAEDKDVYVLESRVKKIMDLMGFNDDEADDLVASFSGGWKMRIGLGKVLLKDPNILLLGKCPFVWLCLLETMMRANVRL